MGITEDIRDRLDLDKYLDELNRRKDELESELNAIKDSLGEQLDSARKEVFSFVDKIKANIKPLMIGAGLFFAGTFAGALSVYYF
jgi:archaellum component FlaC